MADGKTPSKRVHLEATTCFATLPRKWAGSSVPMNFAASPEVNFKEMDSLRSLTRQGKEGNTMVLVYFQSRVW